jgi:hypothetical protein
MTTEDKPSISVTLKDNGNITLSATHELTFTPSEALILRKQLNELVVEPSPTVTPNQIGKLVDKITENNNRSPIVIFQRVIEEMLELGLELGASAEHMYQAINDSVHNQCLKHSKVVGHTVFPSQLPTRYSHSDVIKEMADIRLVMKDLMYVCCVREDSVNIAETTKFNNLASAPLAQFSANRHTFYIKKYHVET